MKAILPGPAQRMAAKMQPGLHRTEKNFLPWRFSLLPIDGETEKGFSAIQSRQKRSCGHAFIRDRTEDAEPPCGTLQISRFCLCREATIRILPIICRIFMNCLPYGQMRKTVHSLRRQRR